MRLAVVASHPIQYQAPIFRALAQRVDLQVFFAHHVTESDQAQAGFGVPFTWDVDLLQGYASAYLRNVALSPGLRSFNACDTPEIGSRLAEGRFDAVLVQGWHLRSYLQAAFAAKRLGLPLLVRGDSHLETPRGGPKKAAKKLIFPAFLRLFDAALYVGLRTHAYWRHYHYPEKRLFFSPHCVNAPWFRARATAAARAEVRDRMGIAADANVALFSGKLVPFKRPLDLVAAAAQARGHGKAIEILIAGSGPLETEIVAAGRTASVKVHMLGFCNQTAMPGAYAAADVLVLPSDANETWGLVANEALACGLPVILSDRVGSAPDLATDGTAGCVYRMGDIAELAKTLRAVLDARPRPEAIAAKSNAYSIEAAVEGIGRALSFVLRSLPALAA